MEDDEESQSHPSAGSGSPDSPRSNRRITVTVASAAPPQNTLTLALPIQQPRTVGGVGGGGSGGGGGGGREDCWSEGATAVLIDAWGERYLELSRGNLKQKHWKEVADIVSSREDYMKAPKTDIQCKNRIDTVKKKYKLEKAKIASGGGPSTWGFYDRLDQLIGPTATGKSGSSSLPFNASSTGRQQQDRGRGGREKNWGDSVRELTKAIMKFGEAYEQAESSKLQQMVEMQKQSMKFAKELELQRMQFFMKTQLELSQLKHSRRGVGNNNNNHHHSHNHNQSLNHHSSNHNNINNNNHSDDSNN
ncbi:hypothetical protein Ccrd_011958 [Cynara cardunculus var. scolymus]|uniref:Myb/SANT-like DNA-binding domain-containing protein n=1 Tax=Cynara cardunculus var. scolymus TaxID=59895 RepID=A0A124SHI5_CYNCS|nr:hypothetical protein Ccrd_011958 [Cynara cardunculus var. scolymus]